MHVTLWAYRVAYKTPIGTKLFNMVYGFNPILIMGLLNPTLRMPKDLNWNKMSDWLEELEKLDETHLVVVHGGMYAVQR